MAPPLSQTLKAAARSSWQLQMETPATPADPSAATVGRPASHSTRVTSKDEAGPSTVKSSGRGKQLAVKVAPTKPKQRVAERKELDLSVTISVGSSDISVDHLKTMERFLEKECISGLCSIERGGAMMRLHLQMVCRIKAASAAVVSKLIKTYLGWHKPGAAPPSHHVLSKTLRNTGLHTYIGMLGYCIKDKGEDHFDCVQRNVTSEQIEEGVEEYVKHGTPFAKNRAILTHKNLLERAATFCRFKLKKQLGSTFVGVLLAMLQSGQYILSASWVIPVRQGGMEYIRAAALWKCIMQPDTMIMDDLTKIFFEHATPASRLADLGRQQLATTLEAAREGTQRDYVVSDTVLGEATRPHNDIIVVEDSQQTPEPATVVVQDTPAIVPQASPVMYIPVVYGDRDTLNSFVV